MSKTILKTIWRRGKYPITFLVFAVFIVFVGESSLINRFEQQKEIQRLEAEIEEHERKFDKDKETLDRLKNDPEAMKEVAREKYYMKKADEDLFVIEDEE